MKITDLLLAVFLTACAHQPVPALAQSSKSPTPQEISNRCSNIIHDAGYMSSASCFKENEKGVLGHGDQTFFDQSMATTLSYLVEEKEARQIFDRLNTAPANADAINLAIYNARNADTEILNRIHDRQLLLINEAHCDFAIWRWGIEPSSCKIV